MTSWILACCLGAAFPVPASAQDDPALLAGQQYLDRVGQAWARKLPVEKLIGMYIGRRYAGYMRFTVKASAEPGARFEWQTQGELAFFGGEFSAEGRALLAADLRPVSAEFVSREPGKTEKRTLRSDGERWTLSVESGGKPQIAEGGFGKGMTWDAPWLPFFLEPGEKEIALVSLSSENRRFGLKRTGETARRSIRGKTLELAVLEVLQESRDPARWYVETDGTALEVQMPGGVVRARPMPESALGRNLDETLPVTPAERVVIDLYLAIKRGDGKGLLGLIDFDRWAEDEAAGYSDLSEDEKRKVVAVMEKKTAEELLSAKMQKDLPEADWLEDYLMATVRSTEKEGVTGVRVPLLGKAWKVARLDSGRLKGKWMVIGVER